MDPCFLSIVIPNYNHAEYLSECIGSALKVIDDTIEVFIIDDASTDHSLKIIQEFAKSDPRIRWVQNPKNLGVNDSINASLHLLRGKYYFGLSADDRLLPKFASMMIPFVKAHPQLDLCTSKFTIFENDAPDDLLAQDHPSMPKESAVFSHEKTLQYFQKTGFWIPGNSTMLRLSLLKKYGGFQNRLNQYSDFFLYHKIALTGVVGYVPHSISAMRKLSTSYSEICAKNLTSRRKTNFALLDLIMNDERKNLFVKSTILSSVIKSSLKDILIHPKYWRFLYPVILKKMNKLFARNPRPKR